MILAIKSAWSWLRDHGKWLAFVGLAIIVTLILRPRTGKKQLLKAVELESKVIEAKAEARKAQIDLGAEKASQKIKEEHAKVLEQLEEKEQARVKELESNPEALIEAILRASP
jgi:hypothetical protein